MKTRNLALFAVAFLNLIAFVTLAASTAEEEALKNIQPLNYENDVVITPDNWKDMYGRFKELHKAGRYSGAGIFRSPGQILKVSSVSASEGRWGRGGNMYYGVTLAGSIESAPVQVTIVLGEKSYITALDHAYIVARFYGMVLAHEITLATKLDLKDLHKQYRGSLKGPEKFVEPREVFIASAEPGAEHWWGLDFFHQAREFIREPFFLKDLTDSRKAELIKYENLQNSKLLQIRIRAQSSYHACETAAH